MSGPSSLDGIERSIPGDLFAAPDRDEVILAGLSGEEVAIARLLHTFAERAYLPSSYSWLELQMMVESQGAATFAEGWKDRPGDGIDQRMQRVLDRMVERGEIRSDGRNYTFDRKLLGD